MKKAFTLAEVISLHPTCQRKIAFTLAEVLITLGIIGVVAALTMPTLIANHKKAVMVNRIKYVYSLISQVLVTSQAENGDIAEWEYGLNTDDVAAANLKTAVDKYFKPYMQVVGEGSAENKHYYLLLKNGITLTFTLDGTAEGVSTVIYIIAGFNGNKRGLTASTRDYSKNDFVLTVAPHKNKLTFFQWGDDRDGLINNASYGCNKNIAKSRRLNCGALIQNDGWEIKEDYPW